MSVNAPELAKREYKQVLNLNPDDWQVKELLDSIKYVPDLHEL